MGGILPASLVLPSLETSQSEVGYNTAQVILCICSWCTFFVGSARNSGHVCIFELSY